MKLWYVHVCVRVCVGGEGKGILAQENIQESESCTSIIKGAKLTQFHVGPKKPV